MLEVTVKTLDSQNHSFSVPDESTVKEFKEQISPVLNIPVEKQRLIFCGKVLKDDKKLKEYDVNGKVIHVVQSLPPQGNSTSSSASSSSTTSGPRIAHRDTAGFVLGAFTIPQDILDGTQEEAPAVDLRISLGAQVPDQSEAHLRMIRVMNMFMRANRLLDSLEDGNGSSNGSSDSSSQTDNDEEIRNRVLEADIGSFMRGESTGANGTSEGAASSDSLNESIIASLPTGDPAEGQPVTERYGLEGLAQVAQAALTAAIATATAAARAATSSINSQDINRRENSAQSQTGTEARSFNVTSENTSEFGPETVPLTSANSSASAMDVESSATPCECDPPGAEASTEENKNKPTSDSASTSGTSQSSANASGNTSRSSSCIGPFSAQTLANLMDDAIRLNTRLQPCLEKCRDLIRNDAVMTPTQVVEAHRLFSKTSQLLHFLSHGYHSLSDLHINYSSPPPRNPRVRVISTPPTMFQHAIPVQAQINISSSVIPSSTSAGSTTTSSTSNTATTTTATPGATSETTRTSTSNPPRTIGSISRANFPRISASTIHSSLLRRQNPMLFMEVTPGSITIDSVSASVDSSPNQPDDDSDSSSRVPGNSAPNSQAETRSDATNSQTSGTRTTIPISLSGSTGPSIIPPIRHLIPVPNTNITSNFDSALPCQSVWALDTSRRRHNAGGSRTSSSRNSQAAPEGVAQTATTQAIPSISPNAPGRQEEQLQGFLNSLVTSLNHANPFGQALTMLTNVALREHRPRTENASQNRERTGNRAENTTPTSTYPNANMNDQIYQGIVQGIRSTSPSDAVNMSMAEFLLGDRCVEIDENDIVSKAFWFVAKQLTLNDFLEASFGNCESFNRLKEPLQKYLEEKIFPPGNTEDENKAVVEQIISNLDDIMEPFVQTLAVKPNIDYKETMHNFFRHNIIVLKSALQGPIPESVQFGDFICNLCHSIFLEFQYVHNTCVEDGNQTLQTAVNTVINSLCSGTMHSFRMALTFIMSRLLSRDPSILIDVDFAKSHIVYKSGTTSAESDPSKKAKSDEKKSDPKSKGTDKNERPRYGDSLRSNEREAAPTLSAIARFVEQSRQQARAVSNGMTTESRTPTAESLAEVVIGSEAWHNTLPRDWVPIIARDVQRQRRQAPQSPFSNAYLSGMPSKRRKIMTNGAPTLLGHSQATLSDMLQQAINSANVKPISSMEEVKKDASQDLSLQAAFTLHMKNAIQERLQRDLDYCSEKFPNAKKYYNIDQI